MEQGPTIPEEETADLGIVTTDETATDKADKQQLRELRYQKAVEREDSVELRETIDIFETPLFFRMEAGILALLEYERIGRMRARGKTLSRFASAAREGLRAQTIFLEAAIPHCQDNPRHSLKYVSTGFENIEAREDNDIWRMVEAFRRMSPDLEESSLVQLISESTRLAFQSEGDDRDPTSDMKIAYEDIAQRQAFINECIKNPEYRKIWLATQKYLMNKHELIERGVDIRIGSQSFGRGGSFLVNPENVDLFTVDDSQGHTDHALEILGVKDIPVGQILGFLKIEEPYMIGNSTTKLAKDAKLIEAIPEEAAKIYGDLPSAGNYKLSPDGVRDKLNSLIDFSIRWQRQEEKNEICAILDIDVNTFSVQEAREKIETMPGVYGRYRGLHPDFPEIPTGELTLKEIEQEIFNISLPRLKEFFPFQNFTAETVDQDIVTALTKYITDRFNVDPEEITINDFIYRVVQSMGIPIYDKEGNQLWPEVRSYEDIHEQSQSKNE